MKRFSVNYIPDKYRSFIREKAIQAAKTRIIIAGRSPEDFEPEDLEIVVREEEDKIRTSFKEKGLLAMLALFGLNFF